MFLALKLISLQLIKINGKKRGKKAYHIDTSSFSFTIVSHLLYVA